MGKITLLVEIDADLVAQLEATGINPAAVAERALKRQLIVEDSVDGRTARQAQWLQDHAAELESYDAFMADHADWNDGLRTF